MTGSPLLPDVGVIGLVPDRWGGIWMPRHHVLTRLARYMHVVWVDAPVDWRQYRRFGGLPPLPLALPQPPLPANFDLFRPRWLPGMHRPPRIAKLFDRSRLLLARRRLARRGARRIVLYLWRPRFVPALDLLPHDLSCYHVDDEYTFSEVEQPMTATERTLLERVDQVFIHSPALLAKKGAVNPRTMYLPNGVDYNAFASPRDEPSDLAALPRPRIGYVGYVKRELDLELLWELAERRPAWTFVLVGPVRVEGNAVPLLQVLKTRPNVRFLGPRAPTDVPAYVQHLDALVLPYMQNDYTKFIYPLKLHEYLATGRPVVATPIRSLQDFGHVLRLAQTREEWIEGIEWALSPGAVASARVAERRAVAREYDWDSLVARIASLLAERLGLAERLAAPHPGRPMPVVVPGRRSAVTMNLPRKLIRTALESVKQPVRRQIASFHLTRACRALQGLEPPSLPRLETLSELLLGWGNEGFSSTPEYLREAAGAVLEGTGPILECGTGASTLVLAVLARKVGRQVWSLEHDRLWRREILRALRRQRLDGVQVVLAPLRDYGACSWYDLSRAQLPPDVSLVVCDGPPSTTPGGRTGLLTVGGSFLRRGCRILFDDATREADRTMLIAWERAGLITFELMRMGRRPYAMAIFAGAPLSSAGAAPGV